MAPGNTLLYVGLGALATESLGITNLTGIGGGGSDGDGDEPPGLGNINFPAMNLPDINLPAQNPHSDLSGVRSQMTNLQNQIATNQIRSEVDNIQDGAGDGGTETVINIIEGAADGAGETVTDGTDGIINYDSPVGTIDRSGNAELLDRVLTRNDTFMGLDAGERTTDSAEGLGHTVGDIPFALLRGSTGAGFAAGERTRQLLGPMIGQDEARVRDILNEPYDTFTGQTATEAVTGLIPGGGDGSVPSVSDVDKYLTENTQWRDGETPTEAPEPTSKQRQLFSGSGPTAGMREETPTDSYEPTPSLSGGSDTASGNRENEREETVITGSGSSYVGIT